MTELNYLKPIPDLKGYFATDTGRIYSKRYGRKLKIMKQQNSMDYQVVCLRYKNIRKLFKVHRLVLLAWLPNPNNHPFVNHKDGNKINNNLSNLEWVSRKENGVHSRDVLGNTTKGKPVCQLLDGELIKRYKSISEAERSSEILGISAVCTGKREKAGGFNWMFEEEYETGIKTIKKDITKEVKSWRIIPEYPEYKISKDGRVYSLFTEKIKTQTNKCGYKTVGLVHKNGRHISRYVHRLVAEAYISNPKKLPIVNHKDGDKSNNHVKNLEWCSNSENSMHAHDTGLIKSRKIIIQMDLEGNEIQRFKSLREAATAVNVSYTCITDTCTGKQKTSAGFKWKFA